MQLKIFESYSSPVYRVFNHQIFLVDCDKWMDYKHWSGTLYLIENGKFSGIEIPNSAPDLAPLRLELEELVLNERVVYKPCIANSSNVSKESQQFFPFKQIKQAMFFRDSENGSDVLHIIEITPNGLFGWLVCALVIRPMQYFLIKSIARKLKRYLSSSWCD